VSPAKDRIEHWFCEFAGERVLLAWVEGAGQGEPVSEAAIPSGGTVDSSLFPSGAACFAVEHIGRWP
jgi:hypothetical protein